MAHAYTTKRGKNKMAKLGMRKDHQQKEENGMKTSVLANLAYDGPKESWESKLSNFGMIEATSRPNDVRSEIHAMISDKCSNPECKTAASETTLLDCASCHQARYCGRECQLSHWDSHKAKCKEIKKLKAIIEQAQAATAIPLG